MKHVHIECLPDEFLVRKLGFTRKLITHHQGKSRVFHIMKRNEDQLAMVDEDPSSVKTTYEKGLTFIEEIQGIKCYSDNSANKIFCLNGKLEDWIISQCRIEKIKLSQFGLPDTPDDLHDQINHKLPNFDKVLTELIKRNNKGIIKLRTLLK